MDFESIANLSQRVYDSLPGRVIERTVYSGLAMLAMDGFIYAANGHSAPLTPDFMFGIIVGNGIAGAIRDKNSTQD